MNLDRSQRSHKNLQFSYHRDRVCHHARMSKQQLEIQVGSMQAQGEFFVLPWNHGRRRGEVMKTTISFEEQVGVYYERGGAVYFCVIEPSESLDEIKFVDDPDGRFVRGHFRRLAACEGDDAERACRAFPGFDRYGR
jgi:hypothetical protein